MRKLSLFFIGLALLTMGLGAQNTAKTTAPDMQLVFAEDETLMVLTGADGKDIQPVLGMSIPAGTLIKTNGTTAELQLVPNGTIVKLTPKTIFKVEAVLGRDQGSANSFALLAGKLRTVAARLSGGPTAYSIRTPTAAGAVRGTDFAMLVQEGQKDWICVQEGMVEFSKFNPATGEVLGTIPVSAGEFADTFSPTFQPAIVSLDRLTEIFSDLQFVKLNPGAVPGHPPVNATKAVAEPEATVATTVPSEPTSGETKAPQAEGPKNEFLAALANALGFQVGSITINGVTYPKAVIQPKIETPGFKLALYLPVIYRTDLFNPSDWYQPKGNNEWSFGFDQDTILDKVKDGVDDLLLKIRYLELGIQGTDPFFLKVGNLNNLSMGHGSLVKGFANDQDFPSVRRLGLNTGFKTEGFAWEGLFDDLTNLQVLGSRVAYGVGGMEIGLSAVSDLYIARNYNKDITENPRGNYGDPALIAAAIDLQLFKFDMGILSGLAFVDGGSVFPYFRESTSLGLTNTIAQGPAFKTVYEDGRVKSYLVTAGMYGKILAFIDYDLEFRHTKGLAQVSLFNNNYNRTKMAYLDGIMNYLDGENTEAVDARSTMGIYGSAGADVLGFVILKGGYFWPWTLNGDGTVTFAEEDNLELSLTIPKGKIPFINAYGSIIYQRSKFAPTVAKAFQGSLENGVGLFDSNTVFGGELVYGLTTGLDLAIQVSTAVVTDTTGNVLYENGQPMIRPSINIETRISF